MHDPSIGSGAWEAIWLRIIKNEIHTEWARYYFLFLRLDCGIQRAQNWAHPMNVSSPAHYNHVEEKKDTETQFPWSNPP